MIRFHSHTPQETVTFENSLRSWRQRSDIGFVNALQDTQSLHDVCEDYSQKSSIFESLVVIGVGGSSLGAKAVIKALCPEQSNVIFWDNNDPNVIAKNLKNLEKPENHHFLIISKSGTTLDVLVITNLLAQKLQEQCLLLAKHISVITQLNANPLEKWARQQDLKVYEHRSDLSGRFSVFSSVGLAPMSFCGLDTKSIISGAAQALQESELPSQLAQWCFQQFLDKKRVTYVWPYDQRLSGFGKWWLQLWSESLAKKENLQGEPGPHVTTPCLCMGSTDQHSQLQQIIEHPHERSVIFLHNSELFQSEKLVIKNQIPGYDFLNELSPSQVYQAQAQGTLESCHQNHVPTCSVTLSQLDELHMTTLMSIFEVTVALLGEALQINTFNQPGVELGKQITLNQLQK